MNGSRSLAMAILMRSLSLSAACSRRLASRPSISLPLAAWLLASAAATIAPPAAMAQSIRTWNVTTGTWSATGNWSGSTVPTSSDTAYFSSGVSDVTATVDSAGFSVLGLSFNKAGKTTLVSDGATAQSGTIGTGGITLASNVGLVTLGGTTKPLNLFLSGTQTWTNNNFIWQNVNPLYSQISLALLASGTIDTVSGGGDVLLTFDGISGRTDIASPITGAAGRAIAVKKNGIGMLALRGVNTFTGGVTLNDGILALGNAAALGSTSGTFTINSGTLAAVSGGITLNNYPQQWKGDFTFDAYYGGNGALNLGAGAVTLGQSVVVTVKSGNLTVGGNIGESSAGYGLTKAGGYWTLSLNGTASSFTGPVTIKEGVLAVSGTGTFNGGANGPLGASPSDAANLFIDGGTLKIGSTNNAFLTDRLFTIGAAGAWIYSTGSVTFTNPGAYAFAGTGSRTLTLQDGNKNGSLAGSFGDPVGGSLSIVHDATGNGAWTLSGSNSFTGQLTIGPATIVSGNAYALGNPSVINFGGGTLRFATAPATDPSPKFTSAAGTAYNISVDSGVSVSLGADLTSTGGVLTKSGVGTLKLTGSNSFASVTLSGGTLQVGSANALGTGTISMAGSTSITSDGPTARTISNPLTPYGSSPAPSVNFGSTAGTGDLTFTGPVNLAAGGGVNSVTGLNNLTFSGAISGTTASTYTWQTGTAGQTVSFTADNSQWKPNVLYFLGTGAVILGDKNALGSSGTVQLAGPEVRASKNLSGTNAIANPIEMYLANVTVSGSNSITFSGGWTHNQSVAGSPFTLTNSLATGATLTLSGTTFLQESTANVGRTLTLSGTGNTTLSGAIVNGGVGGNSSLMITNSGLTVLSASNAFTGTLTGSAGGVRLDSPYAVPGGIGASGGTAGLTIAGGVVILGNGNFSRGLGTTVSTVQITTGGGFAAYGGDRSVNLGGSGAAVTWGVNNFISSGGTLVLGHATADSKVTFLNPIVAGTSGAVTRTIQVNRGTGAVDAEISDVVSQSAGSATIVKTGGGILALTAANSFAGPLQIGDGAVQVASINNSGNGPLGANTTTQLGLGSTSGTLRWVGGADTAVTRTLDLVGTSGGGGAIDAAGAGALTISNLAATGVGTKVFTLTGTSTAPNTVSAVIANASGGAAVSVVKDGPGLWRLSGSNSFTGGFTVKNGTVIAAADALSSKAGAFGSSTSTIGDSGTSASGTATLLVSSGFSVNRNLSVPALAGGASQAVVIGGSGTSGTATFGGLADISVLRPISLVSPVGVVTQFDNTWSGTSVNSSTAAAGNITIGSAGNTGTVWISAAGGLSTTGTVTVSAGRLDFQSENNGANGGLVAAGVTINGATAELKYNSPYALTAPLTFTQGTLSGTGTINTPVTVGSLATLSPGNSPGTMPFGAGLTWLSSGTYAWEINDAASTKGSNPGWDLIDVTGGVLDFSALSAGSPFTLDLRTLSGLTSGSMANYTPGASYSWQIVQTLAGGVVTPSGTAVGGEDVTSLFNLVTTNWASGTVPSTIQVKVSSGGTGLDLVVVPEPATILLAGIGIGLGGWAARRRRK